MSAPLTTIGDTAPLDGDTEDAVSVEQQCRSCGGQVEARLSRKRLTNARGRVVVPLQCDRCGVTCEVAVRLLVECVR